MQAFSLKVFNSRKSSVFFTSVVVLTAFVLADTSNTSAQRKPVKPAVKKKPSAPLLPKALIGWSDKVCIPPKTDYISVLQIDSSGKATLIGLTGDGPKVVFDASMLLSARDALIAAFKKGSVTIRVDPSIKLDVVVKILKDLRSLDGCPDVEASTNVDDPYIYIYPEPKELPDVEVKPNPLTLIVELDENGSLTLNNESKGSLNDTSLLRNSLVQIFKAREDNGVFREGTNLIETTTSMRAVGSAKFGDVVKIVDALKQAGASPVGLLIDDDLEPLVRKEIISPMTVNDSIPKPPKTRPRKRSKP